MNSPRISASSYSNTAPLVWSFLFGQNHGLAELIMDTAPARSAELLAQDRVDAALVPVIAYQMIEGVSLVPDVCVGARERVRSVCLVTRGGELEDVRSVALDTSSRTSAALTKIIFREFFGFEPTWSDASPDIDAMLGSSDAALLIGDPALVLSSPPAGGGVAPATPLLPEEGCPKGGVEGGDEVVGGGSPYRTFDLAELWRKHTGFGFVFAMWMTRRDAVSIDFAAARDEGLAHIDEIVANYESQIDIGRSEMHEYLSTNISYSIDDSMMSGLELYFKLAAKNGLIANNNVLRFV
jgi:chorismate dehydratase